jgi:hypothetical protein
MNLILYTSFPFLFWGSDRYQLKDRWKIINPSVIIRMWNMYVRPRMLFGLDCVLLSKKDYSKLSSYHKSFLKMIMNLSEHTADAAVYILSGEYRPLFNLHFPIFMNLILYTSFPFLFWGSDRYQLKERDKSQQYV